jgi:hypothetical protein
MHGRSPILPACLGLALACGDATSNASSDGSTDTSGDASTDTSGDTTDDSDDTTDDTGDTGEPEPPVTIGRAMSDDLVETPQYLVMRKSPTVGIDPGEQTRCEALLPALAGLPFIGNAGTCVVFSPYILDTVPDQAQRRQLFRQGFEEVRVMVGAEQVGERRLAVEIIVYLLNDTIERNETYLADLLYAARAAQMPVLINLDAVNWWGGRPDLWNFFDPNQPGYDPANVDNVEWIGPTPDDAPRVYWRNWGAQIRVATPIPNFGSPKFRAAIEDVMSVLVPHIRGFVDGLAPDERYLYAGTIIGTELAIGVNHYHYPNGNSYLGQDPQCDPGLQFVGGCPANNNGPCPGNNHGICPPNFNNNLSGGVAQVGYHAALDLGLITPEQPMTQAVNDEILRNYTAFFDDVLRDAGLPRNNVFAHTGGVFDGSGPQSLFAAETRAVIAGWSMYYEGFDTPSISTYTDSSDQRKILPWASPEWLPLAANGGDSADTWHASIEASLNFRNNRMIAVANWEGVSPNPNAIGGIHDALTTPNLDACVVVPRVFLGAADFGDGVGVRFSRKHGDTATYLNASTDPTLAPGGGLANVDVANAMLGDETSWFFEHDGDQPIYVQLITDGCNRDGAVQRTFSEVFPVVVHGTGDFPPAPRIYTTRRGAMQIFAWDADPQLDPIRLQIARDDTFTDLALDEDVSAYQVYVRDGYAPGATYYAQITVGGTPSNITSFAH